MMIVVLWILAYLATGLVTSTVLMAIFPPSEFEGSDGHVISDVLTWPIIVAVGVGCILAEYVICPASDWVDSHRSPRTNWCLVVSQKLRRLFVKD